MLFFFYFFFLQNSKTKHILLLGVKNVTKPYGKPSLFCKNIFLKNDYIHTIGLCPNMPRSSFYSFTKHLQEKKFSSEFIPEQASSDRDTFLLTFTKKLFSICACLNVKYEKSSRIKYLTGHNSK